MVFEDLIQFLGCFVGGGTYIVDDWSDWNVGFV